MTKISKCLALIALSLSISLSAVNWASAADKAKVQPGGDVAKPVEIKTYTIIGHSGAAPDAAAAKSIPPQLLARGVGPGRFGPGGRPGNPAMAWGVGPSRH